MGVAHGGLTRGAREGGNAGWIGLAQHVQDGGDRLVAIEGIHALATGAKLADGLGAAEKQFGHDGALRLLPAEDLLGLVLEALHARGAAGEQSRDELGGAEDLEGVPDGVFVEVHERVAVALLVAGGDDRVGGHRVVLGLREGLLEQHAEDATFDLVECFGHGGLSCDAVSRWRFVLRA